MLSLGADVERAEGVVFRKLVVGFAVTDFVGVDSLFV